MPRRGQRQGFSRRSGRGIHRYHGGQYRHHRRHRFGYGRYYAPIIYPYYLTPMVYYPTSTMYGNCDCTLGSGRVTSNNCNSGVPICVGGNCTCYHYPTQTTGCYNTRGATC